jgi:hypothetical protein
MQAPGLLATGDSNPLYMCVCGAHVPSSVFVLVRQKVMQPTVHVGEVGLEPNHTRHTRAEHTLLSLKRQDYMYRGIPQGPPRRRGLPSSLASKPCRTHSGRLSDLFHVAVLPEADERLRDVGSEHEE